MTKANIIIDGITVMTIKVEITINSARKTI